MNPIKLFTLCLSLCLNYTLFSQSTSIEVLVLDFERQTTDPATRAPGAKVTLDLRLHLGDSPAIERNLEFDIQLKNQTGTLVYQQKGIRSFFKRPNGSAPKWLDSKQFEIFIPFSAIELEPGVHQAQLLISGHDLADSYPDFLDFPVRLDIPSASELSIQPHHFKVSNLKIQYDIDDFMTKEKGVEVSFTFDRSAVKASKEEQKFDLYWEMIALDGRKIFDSERGKTIFHRKVYINSTPKIRELDFFCPYSEIDLPEPDSVRLVLTLKDSGIEDLVIYDQIVLLEMPNKYWFKEQEFTVSDFYVNPTVHKGVQGMICNFKIYYKYNEPLRDSETGPNFHYHWIWTNREGKSAFHDGDDFAAQHSPDHKKNEVSIFIPYRLVNLQEGKIEIDYTLEVTDKTGSIKFPPLSKGKFEMDLPKRYFATLDIDELEVVYKEYDSHLKRYPPELFWELYLGQSLFRVETLKNSFIANTGKTSFYFTPGDEILLKVWDEDLFLNPNDLIENYEIPYSTEGYSINFEKYEFNDIKSLSLNFNAKPATYE